MIDKLNLHYSFTNPASIHDEEALTALELAGRQAVKINEVINDQNNLRTETENHLDQQDGNIDQRMDAQDKAIQKMNDETMPAKVVAEMQRKINDGTFADEIDKSLGNLNTRVDNLLGNLPAGPTAMDAEIIDARQDFEGVSWANMGQHIRIREKMIDDCLKTLGEYVVTPAEHVQIKNGFWTYNNYQWYDNQDYFTYYYNVQPGDIFVTNLQRYGTGAADAVLLDREGNVIQHYHTNPTLTFTDGTDLVVVPEGGGTQLAFTSLGNIMQVYKVTGFAPLMGDVNSYIDNRVEPLMGGVPVLASPMLGNVTENVILYRDGTLKEITTILGKYFVAEYNVTPGKYYNLRAGASYGNAIYALYNASGKMVSCLYKAGETITMNEVLVIPPNIATLRVASENNAPPTVQEVVSFDTSDHPGGIWGHLKWCCIGDSITESNIRTDKHYFEYVQDKTGIKCVNMGLSGSGFLKLQEEGKSYVDRITNVPMDCDVVTIFASGNDLTRISELGDPTDTNPNTICGCVNRTLDLLFARMPTVRVGITSPTPWLNQTPDNPNCYMSKYSDALAEICKLRGIPFLDLFHLSGFRPNDATYRSLVFSKDPEGNATHPNELGHMFFPCVF